MIVKVQVPLNGPGPALVYDQERKHQVMMKLDANVMRSIGRMPKAYFDAAWDAREQTFTIGKKVEAQSW